MAWEDGKGFCIRRVIGVACLGGSFKLDLSLGKLHSAEPDGAPRIPCASRGASAHKQTGRSHRKVSGTGMQVEIAVW